MIIEKIDQQISETEKNIEEIKKASCTKIAKFKNKLEKLKSQKGDLLLKNFCDAGLSDLNGEQLKKVINELKNSS